MSLLQIDVLFLQFRHFYILFLCEWLRARSIHCRQCSLQGIKRFTVLIKVLLQLGIEFTLDIFRLVVDSVQDLDDLTTFEAWNALKHLQKADVRKDKRLVIITVEHLVDLFDEVHRAVLLQIFSNLLLLLWCHVDLAIHFFRYDLIEKGFLVNECRAHLFRLRKFLHH